MGLLSMTDCTAESNRVQARYELDAAERLDGDDFSHALAGWSLKWGRELLDFADNAPSEDEVADDLRRAQQETDDASQSASERADAIRAAISKIDGVVADLEQSL